MMDSPPSQLLTVTKDQAEWLMELHVVGSWPKNGFSEGCLKCSA
jgi:hypothetical protein